MRHEPANDHVVSEDTASLTASDFDDDFEHGGPGEAGKLPADRYLDREMSWLAFNQRVMELAEDPTVPILERANYLAIFASNLDEFFMVRVAGLKRRIDTRLGTTSVTGLSPEHTLANVFEAAEALQQRHNACYLNDVLPGLREANVEIATWDQLAIDEQARMSEYFQSQVFPVLMPLAVDPAHPFPYISGLSLNLAVRVRNSKTGKEEFARLKVPQMLPRFVSVSTSPTADRMIALEDVIAQHLETLFPGMDVLDHHVFRITRNEEVEIDEDETENLIKELEKGLSQRRFGPPIRLEITDDMDEKTLDLLVRELDISGRTVVRLPGPLDLRGLFQIAALPRVGHRFPNRVPMTNPQLVPTEPDAPVDIFAAIRKRDILVHHPYQSFATSVQAFIEQAAADPAVLAIKQTLYRTSGDSPIMKALIAAAAAGKQVLALVEVKARFDERANIDWARQLEKAGVHVVYGIVGLKTHSKLALVVRQEGDELRRYSHIGTGYYNPKTSRVYEDLGLLTDDEHIGEDVTRLFNELSGYAIEKKFDRLLVAPRTLRKGLQRRVREQRKRAKAGLPARIRFKLNSLVDEGMIDELYRASNAGVQIELWVRGISSLRPGVPGLSENIRVRSVLGRYLEHSRVYEFGLGDEREVFIGSADLMHRNLDRRIEVVVKLNEPTHMNHIDFLFDTAMRDDVDAWELDGDGAWHRKSVGEDGHPLAHVHDLVWDAHASAVKAEKKQARKAGWVIRG